MVSSFLNHSRNFFILSPLCCTAPKEAGGICQDGITQIYTSRKIFAIRNAPASGRNTDEGGETYCTHQQARRKIVPFLRVHDKEEFILNENSTVKDLEAQAANTKHLMDKLNRAAYGMTMDEALRLHNTSNHDHSKAKEDYDV